MVYSLLKLIISNDRIYAAQLSALEQNHCAHVACDCERVTTVYYGTLNKKRKREIHWSGVLTALFGCYMSCATWNKLPSSSTLCAHHTTSSLQCHFIPCHVCSIACVFGCNLPPALLAESHWIFHVLLLLLLRWNGYRKESEQKVDPGEEHSPAAPTGTRPETFLSRVRRTNWPLSCPTLSSPII